MNNHVEAEPHLSLALLAEAASVALQEKDALMDEDLTRLELLIKKREKLMDAAWEQREGCDTDLLMRQMIDLASIMEQLTLLCQSEQESARSKLTARKQHRHYTSAPRARMVSDNKRLLFDKPL